MVSRVSLASPRSARSQEFAKSAWRVVAIAQSDQIGLLRGVLQRKNEPLHLATLRCLGSSADLRVAQAGQGRFVGGHVSALLGGGEQLGSRKRWRGSPALR